MRNGLIFIMLTMFSMSLFGQLQVNGYAKVDLIAGTTLNCSYLDETYDSFEAGDIIMVYQVQDNVLGGNTGNSATFGNVSSIKNAGVIEFAEISNVLKNGDNMVIVMSDFLDESFSTAAHSSVQVITFPEFPDFVTTDDITGKAWDGNTGGVIAFNVPGLFTLKNDIFADGIGFRGGSESDNAGISCDVGTYRTGDSNYGGKGESIYKNSSQMHYGKGKIANGAGGGNPHNGGGAGGSNFTAGGFGGAGWGCADKTGGVPGLNLSSFLIDDENRAFFGGGGGGGQQNNNSGTAGGTGGGLIFIKANEIYIESDCSISANGENGEDTFNSGNDGAGGGGAGGSVLISTGEINFNTSVTLEVSVNGGNGGNVIDVDRHGNGGGAGAGTIKFYKIYPNDLPQIILNTNAGLAGRQSLTSLPNVNGEGEQDDGALHYLTFGGDLGELLPVELVSFGVDCEDNKHRVFWTTATENNNDYFLLHASNDGKEWKEVERISGAGTSYHYLDYELYLNQENNYYRLTQVDFDGSKEVFEVVVANCSSNGEESAIENVYYDGSVLNLKINGFLGNVEVVVSNGIARPVYHKVHTIDEFNHSFRFPMSLKSGMYIVTLMQNGHSVSEKILVF